MLCGLTSFNTTGLCAKWDCGFNLAYAVESQLLKDQKMELYLSERSVYLSEYQYMAIRNTFLYHTTPYYASQAFCLVNLDKKNACIDY